MGTKLRSVRSTYLALLGAAALAVGVGVFSAATVKTSHIDWATFDPVQTSLSGSLVVQLVFGAFGKRSRSPPSTRQPPLSLPYRGAWGGARRQGDSDRCDSPCRRGGIAFAAFFAGQLVLSGKHLGVTLADPDVLRAVAGAGFYLFIVTLVGLGLGAIIRHTAGVIAAVGLIFIQALLVNAVFPDPNSTACDYVLWWAGQSISSTRAHITNYRSVGQSLAVCITYAAALLAAASFLITLRDA